MSARTGSMSTDGHGCLTEVAKMVQKIVKILLSSYVEERLCSLRKKELLRKEQRHFLLSACKIRHHAVPQLTIVVIRWQILRKERFKI